MTVTWKMLLFAIIANNLAFAVASASLAYGQEAVGLDGAPSETYIQAARDKIYEEQGKILETNGSEIDFPEYSDTYKNHTEENPILGDNLEPIYEGPITVSAEINLEGILKPSDGYGIVKVTGIMKNQTISKQVDVDEKLFQIYKYFDSSVIDKHNDSVFANLHFKNNIRADEGDTFAVCATMLETGQNDCQSEEISDNPRKLQEVTLFD